MRAVVHISVWRRWLASAAVIIAMAVHGAAAAQVAEPAPASSSPAQAKVYAVEYRIGPRWRADKPAGDQEHFRDHSAHLRSLREQGSLVLGARYGDKGLILLSAGSEAAARAMVEQDLAVRNGIFSYELHEFSVFYGGAVQPRPRGP